VRSIPELMQHDVAVALIVGTGTQGRACGRLALADGATYAEIMHSLRATAPTRALRSPRLLAWTAHERGA
jgi:hypothetical protein